MSQEVMEYTAQNNVICALAEQYGMTSKDLYETLKKTVFKAAATNEQFFALCLVAKQYGLNPLLKEIYAFPAGGGVVPMVGVDGYIAMAQRHPSFDGMEYSYSEETAPAGNVKAAPVWIECRIFRKGCSRPTIVREYMDECYRNTDPWRTHPRRMLRHKATCQCIRTAFGMSGVYADADDVSASVVEDAKPNVNDAISAAIEAPALEPRKRGRPRKVQPAPQPVQDPVQQSDPIPPAQEQDKPAGPTESLDMYAPAKCEEMFDDFCEDAGLDHARCIDACMRMVQDGEALDLVAAKRLFVERRMSI